MSVLSAVDCGVYLHCGVAVCMSVWCAVHRGFILLCCEKVVLLAWSVVDNEFNVSYDATVSVITSTADRVCFYMIQLSREESEDPISYANRARDVSCPPPPLFAQART
jgi:hypothetical protein